MLLTEPAGRSWKFTYGERVNFILIFGGKYEGDNFYLGYFGVDISLYKMISEFFPGFDWVFRSYCATHSGLLFPLQKTLQYKGVT